MADQLTDDADRPAAPDEEPAAPAAGGRRRRPLDRRTLAICACVALLCALVAALLTSVVLSGDDDTAGTSDDPREVGLTPVDAGDIDSTKLLQTSLTTLDGEKTSLADQLDGKPVLINLWFHNCAPCVFEMPLLEEISQANPDLDVLGVATQDKQPRAEALAEQTGITYPWVLDPLGTFAGAAKAPAMPHSVLVDPSGTVLATKTGEFKSRDEIQSFLDDALG